MAKTAWQQRIRRAENLADRHPFAAEMLGFYIHVARFQEDLYLLLDRTGQDGSAGVSPSLEWASHPLADQQAAGATNPPTFLHSPQLLASFPEFLTVVEENGPQRLAQVASELRGAPANAGSDLLNAVWSGASEPPSSPHEFLAFAFLQPCAELARSRSRLQLEGYTHSLCPLCNRKPALGVLRQQGDGGRRSLLCGFCVIEWEFRRVVCPGCGQEDHAKLPVYTAESFPHIRVECCDTCQTYIKSIDLTKNGLADPLVDELSSIPLNLWAQEHGYAKLHPNLLGM